MLATAIDKTYNALVKMNKNTARINAHRRANPMGLGTKLLIVFLAICIGGLLTAMDNSMYTVWDFFEGIWYGLKNGTLSW
ncbi:hypothetical protein JCM19233_6178 [Vibrio astriarenae]|nr:hypothetical protein JCM19233_6178 [Vibrio sp. C7]